MDLINIKNRFEKRTGKPLGIHDDFAVLIPLIYINNELHLLYEVRAKDLDTQPGEISFPGGKVEYNETFKKAAVRETHEELRLSPKKIKVLGELDYMILPYNISIYPYVAFLNDTHIKDINFSEDEVHKIFTVPLKYLLKNKPKEYKVHLKPKPHKHFPYHLIENGEEYNWRTGNYPVYFYEYDKYTIWGITARITKNFIDILKNEKI
ncbi:MAG: CoA pyrophosphatase [Firmicutes bacterium]|nr:CoA pyrophosphatase [Bacillota bacterium]